MKQRITPQPGVPSVTVRKWMYLDEAMMQAQGSLINRVYCVLQPVTAVVYQISDLGGNGLPVDSDVLVRPPKLAGPPPGLIEHHSVQLSNEVFG